MTYIPSYRIVNFSLRPAKSVERKMLAEAFRLLSRFGSINAYRYIGLGSNFFSDFILFHKSLGITNMTSIEQDRPFAKRFAFNRPFLCVDIKIGESGEILPTLNWSMRTILWLDYDLPLDPEMLADVRLFCTNAPSGSMIIVTVDARAETHSDEASKSRLPVLKSRLGKNLPRNVTEKDLAGWGIARVYRTIINNEIEDSMARRNGFLPRGTKILYRQLFNFHYQDSARMLSVGGLIYDDGQTPVMESCGFRSLEFYREGDAPYEIQIPNLTLREIRHIDSQLPNSNVPGIATWIPKEELEKYARIYRYFPAFVEAEL